MKLSARGLDLMRYVPLLAFCERIRGHKSARWTRAAGKVLPGLVARRGRESALFLEPMATLTELSPVKSVVMEAGANAKAMMLGFGVFAGLLVLSRRIKAAVEGRAG